MPPMPPKPAPESEEDFSDEDDENESESDSEGTDSSEEDTTTTESSEEEEEFSAAKKGPTNATAVIKNKPHDEEFHVTNSSAPAGAAPAKQPATKQPAPAAAQQPGRGPAAGHSVVQNRAHDEEFQVESAPSGNNKTAPKPAAKAVQPTNTGGASSGKLTNTHMDEFEDVENDVPDSPKKAPAQAAAAKQQTQQPVRAAPSGVGEREIKNNKADLEFVVNPNAKSGAGLAVPAPGKMTTMKPPTPSDSSASSGSERDTDEEDEESHHNSSAHNQRRNDTKQVGAVDTSLLSSNMSSGPTVTTGATSGLEYNPNDYLHVTQSVPADVRDIFAYITAYSATAMECPAKLRPFIPDYIPSVGDIDTFCKVPRPDDKPDQYGLAVVDEPSSRMSNPTIIKQILIQTETGTPVVSIEDQLMDSLRDASRKPEAIDKWIEDVRLVHGKKAAPTVYYSKPMPSIDSLMQAWPQGFEDVLNSDLQLPPPNIDLDMEQYVRMLCAILDIPVHTNLVESLHVMFTLYLEFRENQHFKAA